RARAGRGRAGEGRGGRWWDRRGCTVRDRNWRGRTGGIDRGAQDGDDLVVVEVKTRRSLRTGHPAEAVTPRKLSRLRMLAGLWLAEHEVHAAGVRVDVVAIWLPHGRPTRIDHRQGGARAARPAAAAGP